jgi:uncharacterized membrane protein YhhN
MGNPAYVHQMGENMSILLILATLSAGVFLSQRDRSYYPVRPYIKAAMCVLLALYCLFIPSLPNVASPLKDYVLIIMAIGFGFSALGDYFLDFPKEKYFLAGLIAFFAAHIAFAVYLWPHMVPLSAFTPIEWGLTLGLTGLTLWFFIWIRPSLDKELVVPVAAYSIIITVMGIAALTTTLHSLFVPVGAALFIASDVVLSIDKFKQDVTFPGPVKAGQINWILYASGQILLAYGVVASLTSVS